ncbi:nucleoside-diphosphate kinase [bacterium]|nr:nucleoside-diphosphate kinase [bacterium]
MERTLVLLKPDALQRNLLGEIISRFEKKGLKIVGLKMIKLSEEILEEHYAHHKDKPFFRDLVEFMKSSPVVAMVLEGIEAVESVRLLVGPTLGRKADAGSIRGDFSMSQQHNIIHASDSLETAEKEIYRFFNENEIFDYQKIDLPAIYSKEELEK